MELIECKTCGSHSFTNGKCDYCGNQYKVEQEYQDLYDDDKHAKRVYGKTYCDDGAEAYAQDFHEYLNRTEVTELGFNHGNTRGDKILTFMLYLLLSIIWFAVCVFIPPLFLITICGLIIWVCRKVCKKY